MNIIFGGYRKWALDILTELKWHNWNYKYNITHVKNKDELSNVCSKKTNTIILLAGWSWYVPKNILENNIVVGLHPSDLPYYGGGTPIQHQIIEGITESKMTLFKLNEIYDQGSIIEKCKLSLKGNIDNIFSNLTKTGIKLFINFLKNYPDYTCTPQVKKIKPRKGLKPKDSKLTLEKLTSMSSLDLYNFIRCRQDPYPNVFIEDEKGILYIKNVSFKLK